MKFPGVKVVTFVLNSGPNLVVIVTSSSLLGDSDAEEAGGVDGIGDIRGW